MKKHETNLMLFPEISPFNKGYLKVSNLHKIFYEESGAKNGKPVVVLHGGPGAGISPNQRRWHDPKKYRIITFDQRGCGRSTPYAELQDNTTWDLVQDIEQLRIHLSIERWQVCGGSWGSTLAIAYAQTHPSKVTEMILRGIFLATKEEIGWFYQKGADFIFPEEFHAYKRLVPEKERGNIVKSYYKHITKGDPGERLRFARAWTAWEASALSLLRDDQRIEAWNKEDYATAFASIESHYFANNAFLENEGYLLSKVSRLEGIPAILIHGRYDIVTPIKTAWDLSRSWKSASLNVVPAAGHASTEPGIIDALIRASNHFVAS